MRWLFLVLMLLNVLYALWNWQHLSDWLPEHTEGMAAVAQPSDVSAASGITQAAVAVPELAPGVSLCMMLGPLEQMAQAHQVRQRLLALNVAASVRPLAAAGPDQYWLLLEGEATELPAQAMARLRAAGFDGFQVADGPFSGRIAVGLHEDAAYAMARRAQIESHGFAVNLQTASAARQEYWVEVAAESRRLVDQRMLATLRRDFAGLQHQFRPCAQ